MKFFVALLLFTGIAFSDNSTLIQPDGKKVVVSTSSNEGKKSFLITRYAVNGNLDTTFRTTGHAVYRLASLNSEGFAVELQPDNHILVGGKVTDARGKNRFGILRMVTNGNLDTTFNTGGYSVSYEKNKFIKKITLEEGQSSSHFVIAAWGCAQEENCTTVKRFQTNGSGF